MSRKMQRMSSTLMISENEAYLNWIKEKDEQKLRDDRLKIYETNKRLIEQRIEEEKRRVLNEIAYWKWFEKKTKELKEKKLIEEENERQRKEMETMEKEKQAIKDMKFNEWLERKLEEEKLKKRQMLFEKHEKECENEIIKCEQQQAKYVWKLWLAKKEKHIQEEKLKKKKEAEEKEKEKEKKQKLSQEKLKEWMKKAANRPKPVKNNLGFTSLSCTNIGFVNPEPWKNIIDDKKNTNENNVNDYDKMFTILYKKPSNVNSNNSNVTMKSFEDCCESSALQRTADWVKRSTTQNILVTKLNENNKNCNCNYKTLTPNENTLNTHNDLNAVIKLDRNKSAPVCLNRQNRKSSANTKK